MTVYAGNIIYANDVNQIVLSKYKPADTSRNTTTTYADDPDLLLPVIAGGVYHYLLYARITAGATPQMKIQFTFPSGGELDAGSFDLGTAFSASTSPQHSVTGITGTNAPYRQEGTLFNGNNTGYFTMQWAQTVSNGANVTIEKGSSLLLFRMA